MSYQEFKNKYNGQRMEWVDPSNPFQCMDLVVAWIEEGLGFPRLTNGIFYAYQLFTNPTQGLKEYFEFIPNTPTGVPQQGDIMVWSSGYGPAGHTAIVEKGDVTAFSAFSQNDPIGALSTVKVYGYTHVLGWLRAKKLDPFQACLAAHKQAVDSANQKDKELKVLKEQFQKYKKEVEDAEYNKQKEFDKAKKELEDKLKNQKQLFINQAIEKLKTL